MTARQTLKRKDRPWSEYPTGTKAHAFNGGYWIKTEHGWKWCSGSTFPRPGGAAIGACMELPTPSPHGNGADVIEQEE